MMKAVLSDLFKLLFAEFEYLSAFFLCEVSVGYV